MIAAIETYLAVRRATGFALSNTEYLLRSFARRQAFVKADLLGAAARRSFFCAERPAWQMRIYRAMGSSLIRSRAPISLILGMKA